MVARREHAEEWLEIKDAVEKAGNNEPHDDIEGLIDRGIFVRRTDDDITISTDDGDKTYPIKNLLLSVPPDVLERDDYGREEED